MKPKITVADEILHFLKSQGPATAVDMWDKNFKHRHLASVSGRFTELRESGKVRELGRVASKYSGKLSILWALADDAAPIAAPVTSVGG